MNANETVKFDDLIRTGRDVDALRYFAEEVADLIESLKTEITELRKNCDILDAANTALHGALQNAERRADAAVEDLEWLAGTTVDSLRCNICKYNPNDMGCELDGSQFDDDGECHFTWCGPQEVEHD